MRSRSCVGPVRSCAVGRALRGIARPPTQQVVARIEANKGEFAGRADLQGPADRPEHLLRIPGPAAVGQAIFDAATARVIAQVHADNYRIYGARKVNAEMLRLRHRWLAAPSSG